MTILNDVMNYLHGNRGRKIVPRPNYQGMSLLEVCTTKNTSVGQDYRPLAQQIVFGENNRPIYNGNIKDLEEAYNGCWLPYHNSETTTPLESGLFRGTLYKLINEN